jgi:hypothetical protein
MILTESEEDFLDRARAWIEYRSRVSGISQEELEKRIDDNILIYFNSLVFTNKDSVEAFNAFKKKILTADFKPMVYILDHFSNNFRGDENSNNEVAAFLNILRVKARQEGAAIVVPHHPSKGGVMLRGASVLLNNCPVVFDFFRDECKDGIKMPVEVRQPKCAYKEAIKPYFLKPIVFDLYMDDSFIRPRMRTGLVLTVDNGDGDDPDVVKPRFDPNTDNGGEDDAGATLHDSDVVEATAAPVKPQECLTERPNEEKRGKGGRPPDIELQKKILDYLGSLQGNGRDRVDIRTIAVRTVGTAQEYDMDRVRHVVGVLYKQGKVKQYKLKKQNKFLWGIGDSLLF